MTDRVGRAYETLASLEGLARVAAMQGRPERSARLLGASAALRDEMGTPLSPIVKADHDFTANAARKALGERAFEIAWKAGQAMPLDESPLLMLWTVSEKKIPRRRPV